MTTPIGVLTSALADRYRIERELGAGGMATVYLAQDLKHDRKVAIKVLRPELAAVIGAERFLSEIKTTANLSHPHILPLFDSGVSDGILYYVMPFVEGETLRERLTREKQLPIADAVRIGTEVASALDYAHRHQVIHRDIKPENILLHDGRALVADFGIALAASKAGNTRMTETGMSLGTPHYMSPEQAMGEREITARSDVYALGCVVYEMLCGEPPFGGPTAQAIVAKVLTESPRPLIPKRHTIPPNVEHAVMVALEKLPADRYESAAEFSTALTDTAHHPAAGPHGTMRLPVAAAARAGRDWRVWTAALFLLALGAAAGRWSAGAARVAAMVARFNIEIGPVTSITRAPVNALALSPDGQTIVFVGQGTTGNGTQLFTRRLDETDPHPVPGTDGATFPVFSPNGRRLSYFAPGGIFIIDVPLTGGSSSPAIAGSSQILATDLWLDDDNIITVDARGGLVRYALDGTATPVAEPDPAAGEKNLFLESVLPDGRTVIVIPSKGLGIIGSLAAIDVKTGKRTPILDGPVSGAWYADGALIWGEPSGDLRAAPFDLRHLKLAGTAITVAQGVQQEIGGGPQAAVSLSGSLVYVPEVPLALELVDRTGKAQVLAEGKRFHSLRFSPDGRRLALDFTTQGSRSVWTLDIAQKTLSRLSFDNDGHDPVWSRDGAWIAYAHNGGIWRRRSDGSGNADSIYTGHGAESILEFTPDGGMIDAALGDNGVFDLVHLSADAKRIDPLATTPYNEEGGTLSRDGRWFAYLSDETGRSEVYVRPYPDGAKTLVSQGGGAEVRWAPDGRTLYYQGQVGGVPTMIAASVTTSPAFTVTKRTPLFSAAEFEPAEPHANWDISPDGNRFAMARQAPFHTLAVVIGWSEEVRRHAGSTHP